MAYCSQIKDKIKGTDIITYNSTPLPCSNVITDDNLNTIFSKFNTTLCNIRTNLDITTNNLSAIYNTITAQSLEVINLKNQAHICCPLCNFTGTAIQLP